MSFIISGLYTICFMAFMYYMSDRVEYLPLAGIYAVGRGVIPLIFAASGPLAILINFVLRFIVGLGFAKLLPVFTNNLDDYRVIIAVLWLIEFVLTLLLNFAILSVVLPLFV